MFKLIILFFWILTPFFSRSQSVEYIGPINEEITKIMTPGEIVLYSECIVALGKEKQKINWLDYENQKKVLNNKTHYTHYLINSDSINQEPIIKHIRGKKRLGAEKFLFSMRRESDKTYISVYVFY
jgi:hypothetical protein